MRAKQSGTESGPTRLGGPRSRSKKPAVIGLSFFFSLLLWAGPTFHCPAAPSQTQLAPLPEFSTPLDQALSADPLRQNVEEDWLAQASVRSGDAPGTVSTRSDARGACDGVKNGLYGFHTGQEPNPWWQVNLEQATDLGRVVVFNRLDYAPGLHNADQLRLLTSLDGTNWTVRHENPGRHFGGISGAKPLEILFAPGQVHARFVRLQIPSDKPIYFHLDEVEVYGLGNSLTNLALHRPADQSSLSPWSTGKTIPISARDIRYPTAEFIARGQRLASDLQAAGVDVRPSLRALAGLEARARAETTNATPEARQAAYLQVRRVVRQLVFSNPLLNFNRLLFVKRFTQESYPDICLNHMPWVSRPGGDICILSAPTGGNIFTQAAPRLRSLLNQALGPGHIHGLDLWWDGSRMVFGYARAASPQPPEGWLDRTRSYQLRRTVEPIHLFEIGVDGQGLRQLTSGEWSDLDPTFAPNGDIVFVSERCGTSLQCNEFDKDETSCNLYVIKPDGSGLRRLSANKDGDYLPHTLDDGTIGYTRWEYHERSWAYIQAPWFIRPDGTGADAIFKQHFVNPWAIEDARSIPDSRQLVAVAAGHHTLAAGPVVVINHHLGINNPRGIRIVTPGVKPPEGGMDGATVPQGGVVDAGGFYSSPWPLSEKTFLVSYTYGPERDTNGYALYVIDVFGNKELLYRDPAISCFLPIPLRARSRPPILPDVSELARQRSPADLATDYAVCSLSAASFGVDGIAPGRAKYLRIAEPIGWPYDNARGGQRYGEDHRYGGPGSENKNLLNWTPVRILGDVPLAADGSAHFRVPADTAVYFQLLDENRMELRRMRSFISFQPGEERGCVGCHESRTIAPPSSATSLAASFPPTPLLPPPWGAERPVSFLRDIQPILNQHCLACHSGLKPAGTLDFSSGLTSFDPDIPGYGHNRAYDTLIERNLVSRSAARAQDASVTPPLAYGAHRSKLIAALDQAPHTQRVKLSQNDRLALTMWIDANAPYHDAFVNKRPAQPAYDLAADPALAAAILQVHTRRCTPCHQPQAVSRLSWIALHDPDQSLFLTAPLSKTAGGTGRCAQGVYADKTDPDFVTLRDRVAAAVRKTRQFPRRDLLADAPTHPRQKPQ